MAVSPTVSGNAGLAGQSRNRSQCPVLPSVENNRLTRLLSKQRSPLDHPPGVRVNRHPAVLRRMGTSSVSTVRRAVAFNTKVGTGSSDQRVGIAPLAALTSANSACPSAAMRFLTSSTPTPHNKAMPTRMGATNHLSHLHTPFGGSGPVLARMGRAKRRLVLLGLKRSILRHSACSLANK